MSKKKNQICMDESQTERFVRDTRKLARGIDDGTICPTVKEINDEVPDDDYVKPKKEKKGKKDMLEKAVDKVERKAKNKVKSFLGSIGELF